MLHWVRHSEGVQIYTAFFSVQVSGRLRMAIRGGFDSLSATMFVRTYMDISERLRQSEQSRRLAWQVLQEMGQVLEILGDQRIPYEGERKRFRAEGDFLLRALTDLISQCRSQIHQFGRDFEELEKLAGERDLPRDVLQTIHNMARRRTALGLSESGRAPESINRSYRSCRNTEPDQIQTLIVEQKRPVELLAIARQVCGSECLRAVPLHRQTFENSLAQFNH
jgi:hypothetical protein